jgi:murein L,D-transpeptidase YcbB/YkuD
MRCLMLFLGSCLALAALGGSAAAETGGAEFKAAPAAPDAAPAEMPEARAIRERLAAIPDEGTDEEKKERAALIEFYGARANAPLWTEAKGLNGAAKAVMDEIGKADDWGLDPKAFAVPDLALASAGGADLSADVRAAAEVDLAVAVLKYARFARGGRIIDPSRDLNSNLDRRPQLIEPKLVLEGIGAAEDKAAYLSGTNPKHPQFERLRQKYLEARAGKGRADAKRLLANMEMWRWMAPDLGDLYMMANVPAFMIEVVKNGEVIHTERIVAGEIGKQTSIFSRPLKYIVFKPMWRVPESIKVKELWPSLLRGGGLMRQYGLELESKDGKPLDWRTMDWSKADIRDYEVVQPPGRKSVLGHVKFSFPSQHTIFMHDTPDKWMFNAKQRTLSHGCLRLRNPMRVAELILAEDKGWDAAKVADVSNNGPLNNEVPIDRKIRMHIVYFTAWVSADGSLKTYADVYGHEKRVTQALEGKWDQIAKGADHLAPVVPSMALAEQGQRPSRPRETQAANEDFLSNFFGGF